MEFSFPTLSRVLVVVGLETCRNPEPKTTEVDTTYQELDLSKMNTEDNYQSLRVNVEMKTTLLTLG